ncbi:hypothetical protein [Streptococcus merionis]|nr:hypothetical protein [Streptococcus merionis]
MMKKNIIGLGLIALAGLILLKDFLVIPDFGMPLWRLILIIVFSVDALQNAFRRSIKASIIGSYIVFILLNGHFQWIRISLWLLILAGVLFYVGLSFLVNPPSYYRSLDGKAKLLGWTDREDFTGVHSSETDTVFGTATRYVNDTQFTDVGGDVVFSSASIYFDHAMMSGNQATYSGDTVFSSLRLFVPSQWEVKITGDKVFSSVQKSGKPTSPTHQLEITGSLVFSSLEIIYL